MGLLDEFLTPSPEERAAMAQARAAIVPDPGYFYGTALPYRRSLDAGGQPSGPMEATWPLMARDTAKGLLDLLEGPSTGEITSDATMALMGFTGAPGMALAPRGAIAAGGAKPAGRVISAEEFRSFWDAHVKNRPPSEMIPDVTVDFGAVDPAIVARLAAKNPDFGAVPNRLLARPGVFGHWMDPSRISAIDPHVDDLPKILTRPDAILRNGPADNPWDSALLLSRAPDGWKAPIVAVQPDGIRLRSIISPVRESDFRRLLNKFSWD